MSDLKNATEAELEAMLAMRPGEGTAEFINRRAAMQAQLRALRDERDDDEEEETPEIPDSDASAATEVPASDPETRVRAWEEARLAYADECEAGIVPLVQPDPFVAAKPPVPRMPKPKEKSARRYEPLADAPDDAETELTAVIAECRYFMRAMAFESARLTPDARDRLSFIDSARKLAETSAEVGKSIASVRHPLLVEPDDKKRARR